MKTFSTILCALALALAVTHAAPIKKTFPDTTVGFSWFLVFDTPIFEQFQAKPPTRTSIDTKPYNLVWGSSDLIHPYYRESNPNVVLSFYIPWSRDNDGTHDLAYWRAFKPEWVLYKCDRTTPAAQFTDPHIPLDISNPDVIDWQLERYIKIAHDFGYDGIAADNFAVGNALEACGVWKDGQWVQKYTGGWDDPAYTADALHWLETFYRRLTEKSPDLSFGINYSLNLMQPADPRVIAVMDHLDYIMDEAGFTTWGFHKPTPQVWDEISTWIETIQDHGKHYFGINEFVDNNRADKEWGMASYLMSKNGRSSMVCTLIQGYGIELAMPEYDALNIGQPMGKRVQKNGIWFRQYSNGLAVVNVYNDTKTFTLPNDGYQYKDVSGRTYGPGAPITIAGQTGIVMGATSRPATVTLTTASTATVSTTTAASVSTTSGTSGTPSGISSTSASATSSNPNPATSSNPNPVTTSTPNPVTTSTPNPATTSNPNPATTGNPNPATSSTPNPATSANPSATLSSATSVDPNQGTSSSPNPNPASTSTSSNPNPSTLTGPNPPSEAPSTPAPTSTTGSSDPTSAPSSSPATGSPATVAPESTTTTTTTSSPPGTPTIPASTTDVDQPASSASSQSLSSFAVALALFIFAFLW